MGKRGKALQRSERDLLLRIITFFEEEKKKKSLITPYNIQDIVNMKHIACVKNYRTNSGINDDLSVQSTCLGADLLTGVELKLLENEKKYQALIKSYDNILKRTAAATGVSEQTLRNIKQQAKKLRRTSPVPIMKPELDILRTVLTKPNIKQEAEQIKTVLPQLNIQQKAKRLRTATPESDIKQEAEQIKPTFSELNIKQESEENRTSSPALNIKQEVSDIDIDE